MADNETTDREPNEDWLTRALRLSHEHEADQFLAALHDEIAAGCALGDQCVCGCQDPHTGREG